MTLTVYSSPWCPDCRVAKGFLAQHNIPFEEIDIESTPGAADEVVRSKLRCHTSAPYHVFST